MGQNLRSLAGEYIPNSLIADTSFPIQTGGVKLKNNQGVLLRGTVVGKDSSGVFVPADTTVSAYGILTDDIDTTSEEAVTAVVYLSGSFNRSALIFGGETNAETHEETLRTKGIYLKAVL